MEFGSLDGGEDVDHSGVVFVGISKVFSMQDTFSVCSLTENSTLHSLPMESDI